MPQQLLFDYGLTTSARICRVGFVTYFMCEGTALAAFFFFGLPSMAKESAVGRFVRRESFLLMMGGGHL